MRKVALAALLALAVAGCKEGQPAELVAKVQAVAKQTCGFIPAASMAAAVLDSIGGTGGAATAAVAAGKVVCDVAVMKKSGATTLFWGDKKVEVEGCWASDPRCQPDGTLKKE